MTNFSPVSRAEISSRAPGQIFLKKTFAITWREFQPGLKFIKTSCNRIKISARAEK